MVKPFMVLDAGKMRLQISKTKMKIQEGSDTALDQTKQSLVQYAFFLIGEAQGQINNRSGNLSATGTVADIEETGEEIRVPFGFNSVHGAQTDRGGTIYAKPGKSLAIPLPPVLTASGVARFTSPREEPNLTLINGKRWVFLAVVPKKREMVLSDLHWILKRKVEQKGTRFFSETVNANREQTAEFLAAQVKERLES